MRRSAPATSSSSATPPSRRCTCGRCALALARGARVEVILPDGEAHKTLANAARVLDVLIANRFGARLRGARPRRRRGRRPRRFRRRLLPARRRVRAGADDAAGAGGFGRGRQDRRQSPRRQEPDRRLPPAATRAQRHQRARDAAGARAARRACGGHQVRPHLRCGAVCLARGAPRGAAGARPGRPGARHPPLVRDQGGDRRPRRARTRANARC